MEARMTEEKHARLILVRGGGDIATGTIARLFRAGFPLLVLETDKPSAIRRQVCLSEAVYDGEAQVEDVRACRIRMEDICEGGADRIVDYYHRALVPVLVDPGAQSVRRLHPDIIVDAILAKKNTGTCRKTSCGAYTIALGPGFTAGPGDDCVDAVIETMRGHTLGRIIHEGSAIPDTAVPGAICGFTKERVYHAPADGCFHAVRRIGDIVRKDDPIAYVETAAGEKILIRAKIAGLIRGMLRDGFTVTAGFKTADIDPRASELSNCYTISDKARCIAGSVLEEVCARRNRAGDGGKH